MKNYYVHLTILGVEGHMNLNYIDSYPEENFHQAGELRYI